jgi:hypothetical protein
VLFFNKDKRGFKPMQIADPERGFFAAEREKSGFSLPDTGPTKRGLPPMQYIRGKRG